MATPHENADIAVLKTKVENIESVLVRVESKLDAQSTNFVTQAEFSEFKKRWFLSHTLAAISGSVLTGVVIYIITHVID